MSESHQQNSDPLPDQKKTRPVSEFMARDPISITADKTVCEATGIMKSKKIGAILIKDEAEEVIGIFTERDLLNRVNLGEGDRLSQIKLDEVMTRDLITVDQNDDYSQVLEMMKDKNLRHLPVTHNGKVVGIVSVRDIMRHYEENLENLLQKKEAQLLENMSKIKESEERFRTIFNNSAVSITFADNDERIIAWNPLTLEILGLTENELYNLPVENLYPPEEWERIRSYNMRKFGKNYHLEVKVKRGNGELIDADLSVSVLKDSEGDVIGSIGIMRDIRQRKEAETELKKSKEDLALANKDLEENARMLRETVRAREDANRKLRETQGQIIQIEKMATIGTLAAGFAHEIKNPLAIILQGMERMKKQAADSADEKQKQYLKIMSDAAVRANEVVTSILQYSRSARLDLKPVNVYDVVDSAIELIFTNAKNRNILIQKHFTRVSHLVVGDNVMLQQVFFDLMTNAMDAMPKGGDIDVYIDFKATENADDPEEKGSFIIQVKDTGQGMDKKQIAKIFDPFYTTKEVGKGTGLGLSTVFLIVEKHQGEISVNSQAGEGTTFTVSLPAA